MHQSGPRPASCWSNLPLLAIVLTGSLCAHETVWKPPSITKPQNKATLFRAGSNTSPHPTSSSALAESAYAQGLEQEAWGDAKCVDAYFRAATLSWPAVAARIESTGTYTGRAYDVYRSALTRLIESGQTFQRLDPSRGLKIQNGQQWQTVPTNYHGFVWQAEDFNQLILVGHYRSKRVNRKFSTDGLGVATVTIHHKRPGERFSRDVQTFSATVMLRPAAPQAAAMGMPFVLELYDPLNTESIQVAGRRMPLRRDLTAPIVYSLNSREQNYIRAFVNPGATSRDAGLFTIEPYQHGKIPIIFVHGLLSDPMTWSNMANEIRNVPFLRDSCQILGFEYPTGEPFLKSAATLRTQFAAFQNFADPHGQDRSLQQVVLVGHSMGGIVAKLQITESGNAIWNAISNRPLEQIQSTPTGRARLRYFCYFSPCPSIKRVIFVGTPHRGSVWARRPIGRLGSMLVTESSTFTEEHNRLVNNNPNTFSEEFSIRIPTSVDLLEPTSPLLNATDLLPVASNVHLHSIFGTGTWMIGEGQSDGIVPVSSARKQGVDSELAIREKHTNLHQHPDGIQELLRILMQHVVASGRAAQP